MTKIIEGTKKCAICGKHSKHYEILSCCTFGSSDLDTRPSEMSRGTMSEWIQACPYCGYVSYDLEKIPESMFEIDIEEIMKSNEYKTGKPFTFKKSEKLAKDFYRFYLMHEFADDLEEAFSDIRCAAWDCDDNNDPVNAAALRKLGIKIMDKIFENMDDKKANYLLSRADFLRRIGQFDAVIKEFTNIKFKKELYNEIIAFQIAKAKEKDTRCYTIDHVHPEKEE